MSWLKIIFAFILEAIRMIGLYWPYMWVLLYSLAVFSTKYFGNDNMFEQSVEAINKLETGVDVDISKSSNGEPEPMSLKRYIPNER